MILICDCCHTKLTEAEAEIEAITVGDLCPTCIDQGNDGQFQCSYEDEAV